MRISAFSAIFLDLAVGGAVLLVGQLCAEDPPVAIPQAASPKPDSLVGSVPPQVIEVGADEATNAAINAALDKKIDIAFEDTPLTDVVAEFQKLLKITVVLDSSGIVEAGIDPALPISRSLHGISARSALNLILEDLKLQYAIRNQVLNVTSQSKTESADFPVTKIYSLKGLAFDTPEGTRAVECLPSDHVMRPYALDKVPIPNGCLGTVTKLQHHGQSFLIVTDSPGRQKQLADVLAALRRAGASSDKLAAITVGETPMSKESTAKIEAALRAPVELNITDSSLQEIVDVLKERCKIEIQLDTAALNEAGAEPDERVSRQISGISLRSALHLLLDDFHLRFVIHNEVLMITTDAKAESDEYMTTKLYPETDLVTSTNSCGHFRLDLQPLMDLIVQHVDTKDWPEGVSSPIGQYVGPNQCYLVITAMDSTHEKVAALFAALRRAGVPNARGPAAVSTRQPVTKIVLPVIEAGNKKEPPKTDSEPANKPEIKPSEANPFG